jgi:hypothetical protein
VFRGRTRAENARISITVTSTVLRVSGELHSYVSDCIYELPPHTSFLARLISVTEMTSFSKAEKSYVQTSLLSTPPLRADGRSLYDFRAIALETGISPLANGSARLNIGRNAHDGGGGTEVLAAAKLEVEDVEDGDGIDGGRLICTVSWYVTRRFLSMNVFLMFLW